MGYGSISEAKITGDLDEAEDEAKDSPLICVITLSRNKVIHEQKGSFFASEIEPYPFSTSEK